MSGFVTLLGAGPGDPNLLTIKGKRAIDCAEVVVYDRLVSSSILAMIPQDTERINVGKTQGNHPIPQDEINQILIQKALEGKRVLRLKGGDSFVFGRGGEELEGLGDIPFEVIPGITSAIAAPCYAGIPVTHRDYTSSFHVITGHARAGKQLNIDFEALVRTKGTLIFLMGVSALSEICSGLIAGGLSPQMPAAIIEKGTTPQQRKIIATISSLQEEAEQTNINSPAVIIVGEVCKLSDKFDWFSRLPLTGKTIVVTRPRDRIGTLSNRLRSLGADVLEYPCIKTIPKIPCTEMEKALMEILLYEWLVLTSPAGVESFWTCLCSLGKDARWLSGVKIAVVGSATKRALSAHGLQADFVPEIYDTIHLGQGVAARALGKVLVLRATMGNQVLCEELQKKNVPFLDIASYDTIYEVGQPDEVKEKIREKLVKLVCFTSASAVDGFVESLGDNIDLSHLLAICIGQQTAHKAEAYGLFTMTAKEATIDHLIDTILAI